MKKRKNKRITKKKKKKLLKVKNKHNNYKKITENEREYFLKLKYTRKEIDEKMTVIYNDILNNSPNIRKENFDVIEGEDVKYIFRLYDKYFYNDIFWTYRPKVTFKVNGIKKFVGRASMFPRGFYDYIYTIEFSKNFFIKYPLGEDFGVLFKGFLCNSKLEFLCHVLEHEFTHMLEYILWKKSGHNKRFKDLMYNMFGHKNHIRQRNFKEHIFQPGSHTMIETISRCYDFQVGEIVKFKYKNKVYRGLIINTNGYRLKIAVDKRKTVYIYNTSPEYIIEKESFSPLAKKIKVCC